MLPNSNQTWGISPYLLQDLLTILTEVTSRLPCSSLVFFMPALAAAFLVSSFILFMVELETLPLTVMVWPTCSASATLSLLMSQVLPSLPLRTYLSGLLPSARQPVMVRTSALDFPLLVVSWAKVTPAKRNKLSTAAILAIFMVSPMEEKHGGWATVVINSR